MTEIKRLHRFFALLLATALLFLTACTNREQTVQSTVASAITSGGELSFSYPQSDTVYIFNDCLEFRGSCDKSHPLLLNGKVQKVYDDGIFTIETKPKKGEQAYTFQCGTAKKTFKVVYSTPLLQSWTPNEYKISVDEGGAFTVTATALCGITVTAKCGDENVVLSPVSDAEYDGKTYCKYSAIVGVTATSGSILSLTLTAEKGEQVQTVNAAEIEVEELELDESYTTLAKSKKKYYIKVVKDTAETFNGKKIDDYSRPTNSYLPKGTVDSCQPYKIYDSESKKKFYLLSSGLRVYANSSVKLYRGSIKSKTTIKYKGQSVGGNQFAIRLKMSQKTPFTVTAKPQSYANTKTQDYTIKKPTYKYIDVKFYKCTKASGKPSVKNSELFKSCKWIKKSGYYILRLYLKKTGVFYGYDSYYNSKGELVLSFLKPPTITKSASNKYGYSLKGVKIVVDAGHGGTDGGAPNITGKGKGEKYYTMLYANELKNQLTALGATVIMTRTSDKTVSLNKRFLKIRSTQPDLAVSVHFNSSVSSSPRGYFCGYYYPFTYNAANAIQKAVNTQKLLKREKGGVQWHYFNLSRCSVCPVVLTENGYLSNRSDYKNIKSATFRNKYTSALVQGIVNYLAANGTVKQQKLTMASRIPRIDSSAASNTTSSDNVSGSSNTQSKK